MKTPESRQESLWASVGRTDEEFVQPVKKLAMSFVAECRRASVLHKEKQLSMQAEKDGLPCADLMETPAFRTLADHAEKFAEKGTAAPRLPAQYEMCVDIVRIIAPTLSFRFGNPGNDNEFYPPIPPG